MEQFMGYFILQALYQIEYMIIIGGWLEKTFYVLTS